MDITRFIKVELAKRDMNVTDLAQKMECHKQGLYDRLKVNNMKINDIEKIADALDCDLVLEFKPRQ